MSDADTYFLVGMVAMALVPFVVLELVWRFLPEEKKREYIRRGFEKNDLPRIWKKCGFSVGSLWYSKVFCPDDRSRCYQKQVEFFESTPGVRRNFAWFCPVCGRRMDFAE